MINGLFNELVTVEKKIVELQRSLTIAGIMVGVVTHIERNGTGRIRVKKFNYDTNYSTYWLEPAKTVGNVVIGDKVLYCYPTSDPRYGVYFAIIGSITLTEEWVLDRIEEAIAAYDPLIKAWVGANFVDDAELAASLASNLANYATLASKKSSIVAAFRYQSSLSLSNGGGDFAASVFWINKLTTFAVTGVANRTPPPLVGTPTAQDHSNALYRIIFNAAVNGNTTVGDKFYFRIATAYRHYMLALEPPKIRSTPVELLKSNLWLFPPHVAAPADIS